MGLQQILEPFCHFFLNELPVQVAFQFVMTFFRNRVPRASLGASFAFALRMEQAIGERVIAFSWGDLKRRIRNHRCNPDVAADITDKALMQAEGS